MASPFPGMDPYLEAPEIWRGFYHSLAYEIIAQLHAVLGPRYYADVEVRTVLEEVGVAATKTVYPDTAVLETTAGNVLQCHGGGYSGGPHPAPRYAPGGTQTAHGAGARDSDRHPGHRH